MIYIEIFCKTVNITVRVNKARIKIDLFIKYEVGTEKSLL